MLAQRLSLFSSADRTFFLTLHGALLLAILVIPPLALAWAHRRGQLGGRRRALAWLAALVLMLGGTGALVAADWKVETIDVLANGDLVLRNFARLPMAHVSAFDLRRLHLQSYQALGRRGDGEGKVTGGTIELEARTLPLVTYERMSYARLLAGLNASPRLPPLIDGRRHEYLLTSR